MQSKRQKARRLVECIHDTSSKVEDAQVGSKILHFVPLSTQDSPHVPNPSAVSSSARYHDDAILFGGAASIDRFFHG